MRHRKKGKILDRKIGPRKALIRGLMNQMVLYEKIRTTEAKAKVVRPYLERLITKARHGSPGDLRVLRQACYVRGAYKKMREVIAPRYAGRNGGYTRIVKIGPRQGDGAHMALLELV